MKGAVSVLEVILIFGIATGLTALALPWAYDSIQESLDIIEIDKIRQEFEICNDKLINTARTGTGNRCYFSVSKGSVVVKEEGIYYTIVSNGDICDAHRWRPINLEKHLWQNCDTDIKTKILNYKWYYPKDITIKGSDFGGNVIVDQDQSKAYPVTFDQNVIFDTLSVFIEFDFTKGQEGKVVDINRLSISDDSTVLSIKIS